MPKLLKSRAEPIQSRARKQRENILKVTCELLNTVGLDDLTTILVAQKAGISVGTIFQISMQFFMLYPRFGWPK
jgi:predicted anti-sigma-YlaC factor YlaD